ncbi:response regulator [Novosphingobium aquimarinum]|uniref:response regulator n=1 Tax=Novosphingobium aquimarinum TaxID=2682494 RepID=UPI0012EC6EB0|nr:response regulator [Novosphingobium aquimarinum]
MQSSWTELPLEDQVEFLSRRLERATRALDDAETMLEQRMRDLARANGELSKREGELVERLNIENRQLLSAQRTARMATIYGDPESGYTVSAHLAVLLGLPQGSAVNMERLIEAIHPLDKKRFLRVAGNFYETFAPDIDHTFEHRVIRNDGAVRWFEWHVRRDSTSDLGRIPVFGSVRDVTESRANARRIKALQLRAERRIDQLDRLTDALAQARFETEEALDKRNQFISDVAHRIRTPMGGLTGAMELLAQRYPGDDIAGRALEAADSLAAIAHSLIEAADETGRDDLALDEPETFEPGVAEAVRVESNSSDRPDSSLLRTIDGEAPRILLAEDTESNSFIISRLVESLGGEVVTVFNGRDALEAVRNEPFDAVLMDVMMPVMTGEEATRAIRALPGPRSGTPIIGITAHSLQAERKSLLAAGMSACLVKPIRRDALEAALREALGAGAEPSGVSDEAYGASGEPDAADALFDVEAFLECFLVLPPSFRERMLQAFTKDLTTNGEQLTLAIEAGDGDMTDKVAHRLKGICLNVGAVAVVEELRKLRETPQEDHGALLAPLREVIAATLAASGDLYRDRVAHAQ